MEMTKPRLPASGTNAAKSSRTNGEILFKASRSRIYSDSILSPGSNSNPSSGTSTQSEVWSISKSTTSPRSQSSSPTSTIWTLQRAGPNSKNSTSTSPLSRPNINDPFPTPSPGWGPFQPNLEEFSIPKNPTANTLLILAQSCPLLESLQIYLCSTKFEGSSGELALPAGFTGHSNLRKLWLGNCEVDDAISVATRLNLLFPTLQTAAGVIPTPGFNVVAQAGSACGFEWMSVQRFIQIIKDLRAAERARITAILDEAGVMIPGRAQRKMYPS
ncbi:hypothetical protein H1R20_g16529, partial [Candolleomyces eurysporus]